MTAPRKPDSGPFCQLAAAVIVAVAILYAASRPSEQVGQCCPCHAKQCCQPVDTRPMPPIQPRFPKGSVEPAGALG